MVAGDSALVVTLAGPREYPEAAAPVPIGEVRREVSNIVGKEIGLRPEGREAPAQAVPRRHSRFGHDETAQAIWRITREPAPDRGIEGHDSHLPDMVGQDPLYRSAQPGRPAGRRFQFDEKRCPASDQPNYLRKGRNRLRRAAQADSGKGLCRTRPDRTGGLGEPIEQIVVKDHCLAISARLDIELDTMTGFERGFESRATILDPPLAVEAAMRERSSDQALEPFFPIRL